jgi:hypothetical protein
MAIQVNFNLRNPKAETETPINLVVRYSGYQIVHPTNQKIHRDFWETDKSKGTNYQRPKRTPKFPDHASLRAKLDDITSKARKAYDRLQDQFGRVPTPDEYKKQLSELLGQVKRVEIKNEKVTFLAFIERHITCSPTRINEKTGKPISANTIKPYKTVLMHLKAFQKKTKGILDWESLDHNFYVEFSGYLLGDKNMKINSVGKQFQNINAFIKQAEKQKLVPKGLIEPFKVVREEVDAIYLNKDELAAWKNLDLADNPRLDKIRDLFLVSCYTASRYSDIHKYTPEAIVTTKDQEQVFHIVQQKTQKAVSVPVHPIVKEIHAKYNGTLPTVPSEQKMNEYLKEVGEMIPILNVPYSRTFTKGGKAITEAKPKFKCICTHTGRRSFATNNKKDGLDIYKIMNATGHATEKDFWKYVKLTNHEKAISMGRDWMEIEEKSRKQFSNAEVA